MSRQVKSEARKRLREAALARRQTVTTHEMQRDIKKKVWKVRVEKDVYQLLEEAGMPLFQRTPGNYQKFVVDEARIKLIGRHRMFFFPGYGARIIEKRCLTVFEFNIALGLPEGRLKQWIKDGEFPTPIGKCHVSRTKGNAMPAYTIRECLVYSLLLAENIGSPETWDYWARFKGRVIPSLHAAREQILKAVYDNAEPKWKLVD